MCLRKILFKFFDISIFFIIINILSIFGTNLAFSQKVQSTDVIVKSKTCLYKPYLYKTFTLQNCVIFSDSNEVFELYYTPNSSGHVYTGYTRIPPLQKYQIQNAKKKCSKEARDDFVQIFKEQNKKYKVLQTCKGINQIEKHICEYFLDTKTSDFDMDGTKSFFKNFSKKFMNEIDLIKLNLTYTETQIKGTINIINKIYEIKNLKQNEYGFLEYEFPSTEVNLFSSLIVNDKQKSSLSLSGAIGGIDFRGNCKDF